MCERPAILSWLIGQRLSCSARGARGADSSPPIQAMAPRPCVTATPDGHRPTGPLSCCASAWSGSPPPPTRGSTGPTSQSCWPSARDRHRRARAAPPAHRGRAPGRARASSTRLPHTPRLAPLSPADTDVDFCTWICTCHVFHWRAGRGRVLCRWPAREDLAVREGGPPPSLHGGAWKSLPERAPAISLIAILPAPAPGSSVISGD